MKLRNRLLALLCCCAVLLCAAGTTGAEPASDTPAGGAPLTEQGFMSLCENDLLSLWVNTETANIALIDKRTGHLWTAIPTDPDLPASSSFRSIMNVTYSNSDNLTMVVGTQESNVGFELRQLENGLKTIFRFSSESTQFSVPFRVTLEDNYLEIKLLYDEITEQGESRITDIAILPNWGLGNAGEDGYVFIPDGSGAIIDYADAFSRSETYSGRVYGDDPCQDLIYPNITDAQTVRMPVLGIRQGDSAVLSVVTAGDVYATVNAGMADDRITAGFTFICRETDVTGIQQSQGGTRTMTILQSSRLKTEPCIRQYYLTGDDANYSGMARTYRADLERRKVIKAGGKLPATPAVSVEAFGAVPQKKVVFGIPVTTTLTVTTFEQLSALYDTLTDAGIKEPSFYLYGFLSGGYGGKTATSPKYNGKLGGKSGYNKFTEKAGAENVFTVYDIMRSYGRAFDFFRTRDYMSSLNQTAVKQRYRSLATGFWHSSFGGWSYYAVSYQQKLASKVFKKTPAGSGVVFAHVGEEIPSDFTRASISNRDDYLTFATTLLRRADEGKLTVALESGNAPLVRYTDEFYEIPLGSSGFAIESYSVPFYTMIFHGYLPLSSTAVNDEADPALFRLKAFEQGVSATWRVTGEEPNLLKETTLNFLYNSRIDDITDDMAAMAEDYARVHASLANKRITEHKYIGALSVTTYENGQTIVCNYGESQAVYEGQTVIPAGYIVIGG